MAIVPVGSVVKSSSWKNEHSDQDSLREIRLNELRQQIQAGIDSGEAQPLNIEDVIERGKKRHAQHSKASN